VANGTAPIDFVLVRPTRSVAVRVTRSPGRAVIAALKDPVPLTATGPVGSSIATATVNIVPIPTITFFANPATIASGASSTLTWSVPAADTVTIDQGIGLISSIGSRIVSPHHTTTYHLTATNAAGSSTALVTITVTEAPPAKRRAVRH